MHHYDWDNSKQMTGPKPSSEIRPGRAAQKDAHDFIGHKPFVETGRDNWSTNLADI